ncbi:L-threonylcarbamoyladenylate synthase [Kitasatospora sp. P5_F3]
MQPIPLDQLDRAARALEAGELVIVPTSRWYMICADATNTRACRSIFEGKQRPSGKSLVLVTPSLTDCEQRFTLSDEARRLADAFWPGDLALLLPWRDPDEGARHSAVGAPALVTNAPGALGAVASLTHTPIAATTVNISGDAGIDARGPAISPEEVADFLGLTGVKATVILDGGVCPAANHLTIVDCSKADARLVRAGLVHERAVSAVLRREILA